MTQSTGWAEAPDALIGEDGLLEIKCPKSKTHIEWMLLDAVPPEHEHQMSFYMAVTGREWADLGFTTQATPTPPTLHQAPGAATPSASRLSRARYSR